MVKAALIKENTSISTLVLNGFKFRKNKTLRDRQRDYYRCIKKCPASALVSNGQVISHSGSHNSTHSREFDPNKTLDSVPNLTSYIMKSSKYLLRLIQNVLKITTTF